jgi:hypothetical protein
MNTMDQKPSLGRIVHFFPTTGSEPLAAVITRVWSDTCVNLEVFGSAAGPDETQGRFPTSVVQGPGPRTWSWPPRV